MKTIKRLLVVAMVFALAYSCKISVVAVETGDVYSSTIESEEWFEHSVLEKSEMLRIDARRIEKMTDEQLVRAIADYPYLVDIYIGDTMSEGLEQFKGTCDAYNELMKREGGAESFVKYSQNVISEMKDNPREDGRTVFVTQALEDIVEELKGHNKLDAINYATSSSGPTTPNKNPVPYTTPSESHTSAYHATLDKEVVTTYGVKLVRNGSCKYNCHSYAWHSTASSNPYWIAKPTIYMTDGSYMRKFSGSVSNSIYTCGLSVNDKVYYASNTHSALFIDNPLNGAPLATLKVRSKWGKLGVLEHTVTNVPASYNYSTVSIWHR